MEDRRHYSKGIIIGHGKSEVDFCNNIKQNLRLKIEIDSDKNGKKSIQINSLNRLLNNHKYGKRSNFLNYHKDIKIVKGKIDADFKILTIVDTDDKEKEINLTRYLNKEMFKGHHLYEYIVPIYNTPNLECVFEEIGHVFKNKGDDRKKEYKNLLKPYPAPELAREYLKDLEDRLRRCKNTNLEKVINFFLNIKNP